LGFSIDFAYTQCSATAVPVIVTAQINSFWWKQYARSLIENLDNLKHCPIS